METTILGSRVMLGFYSTPSNVVPFWVWYGFWVRTLIRTTQKGTILEGLGKASGEPKALP